MENNGFTVLYDYDSMIYLSVYRIASIADIKKWFREKRTREWMENEIVNLAINRLSNMSDAILLDIEDTGVEVLMVEYFLTKCPNSIRKRESPLYKSARKRNKWVDLIRQALLEMNFAHIHDEWEADDLIKDRAIELGEDNYLICSMDKDLQQIPGIHFNYYRKRSEYTKDEWGNRIKPECKGLSVVSVEDANKFFWIQMLIGDAGDSIKGVPRIGKKRAEELLETSENYAMTVEQAYIDYYGGEEGIKQFDLHKLLVGLGIKYRP